MSSINNFLLAFDHARNELIICDEYGTDIDRATLAYADLEKRYRDSSSVDIVLVGSDSIDTVRITHANYFVDGSLSLVERSLREPATT
ncbi:MAG: hypothetical protein ACTHZ9_13360 [Leucobacter sp.]